MQRKLADACLLKHVPDDVGPRKLAFRGGAVRWRQSPGLLEFTSSGHCFAVTLAASPKLSVAFEDQPYRTVNATAGMLAISPAGVKRRLNWSAPVDSVVVGISREEMAGLAGHELGRTDIDLRPMHFTPDRTAFELAKLINADLGRPDHTNELYLDSLITVLAVHVLRKYSSVARPGRELKGGLSTLAAKRIRDYLHEHFRRKLTTSELAAVCGLSPSHFTQAFARTFGCPPYRYVLERRLDFAEKLLAGTDMAVAEVAFLSGFSSQSHLNNVLKTYRGKTPKQLR